MPRYDYNLIVIGAGSGGLVSAYIAAAMQAKVLLIEKHKMGGDCLNTGCVPSKALIRSAKAVHEAQQGHIYGLNKTKVSFNFAKVMQRVHRVIATIEPHDSIARYTKLGVECITGSARLTGPHSLAVNGKVLTARAIIVATGARPLVPPLPGLTEVAYLTSDTLWQLKKQPKRLLVLGGGPIGCEMAQSFARLGSQVTLVEMSPQILSREDPDVAAAITTRLEAEGVMLRTGHQAVKVVSGKKNKVLECLHQGKTVAIPFDELLIALGRQANVTGFGLEELGVTLTPRRTVAANPFLQTNIPSLYVVGDVTGPYQFTHAAAHQAWYAAVNALLAPFKSFRANYRTLPWTTFTDPEIARVGLNEKDAQNENIPYEVSRFNFTELDRAITDGATHGFVKVLTKPGKDTILGATIVSHHAGDLLAEYVLAMKHGLGLNKILSTIHSYPTWAEANKFTAGVWRKAHTPAWALKVLATFHRWRRQ
jgi:pyruvate/2-oxoglutarate dehydrogenase complex dihydrolipoamide dehydrogenase (E3) component